MKSFSCWLLLLYYYCIFSRVTTAQERPYYSTPKFDRSGDSHRTDVCERYRQLLRDEIELPDALSGLNLSVVLTDYSNPLDQELFALHNGVIHPERTPLFARVMDELASRARFQWRNSFGTVLPIDKETDGNKTWSDLLKWKVEMYDIAMGRWDRTAERIADGISFPEGYYDSSIILVQNSEDTEKAFMNMWSFLLPFETGVWILIIVTLTISGLLYYTLERLDHTADRQQLESEPGSALYYSFIVFTGHNEFQPRTHSARLLAFSLTLWALIVAAAYTANLASFLVMRSQPGTNFQSVFHAVSQGVPICLQEGAALDGYISAEYPQANLVRQPADRQVFEGLRNGICQAAIVAQSVYETFRRNSDVNKECKLVWTGRVEKIVPSGLTTLVDTGDRCSSLVSHVIDYHILQMESDGKFAEAWEEFLSRISDHKCASDDAVTQSGGASGGEEDTFSLSAAEMSGIFILHALLSVVALSMTLIKFWVRRTFPHFFDDKKETGNREESPETMDLGLDTDDDKEPLNKNTLEPYKTDRIEDTDMSNNI